jgi:hypothetical protein
MAETKDDPHVEHVDDRVIVYGRDGVRKRRSEGNLH